MRVWDDGDGLRAVFAIFFSEGAEVRRGSSQNFDRFLGFNVINLPTLYLKCQNFTPFQHGL